MPIKTNEEARQKRIDAEVNRAVALCQAAADKGDKYIMFTTDKSIQRDVRNKLEDEHDIFVPIMVYRGPTPSHPQVSHYGESTEMKLKW